MSRTDVIITKLVESIHQVIREVGVTEDELMQAIQYLTEVGKKSEFHLLSDVLGVSILVDSMMNPDQDHSTPSNVEGPLYRDGAPLLTEPVRLYRSEQDGDPLFISGSIVDARTGEALEDALLDVWQTNHVGLYENEDPDQEEFNLRGKFKTRNDGTYEFETVVPVPYEIPKNGPVGKLLAQLGRHAFRPAHIHFKISQDGYVPLTTQLFIQGDPYLHSDVIGGVKKGLILELEQHDTKEELQKRGIDRPFSTCQFNIALNAI